jgi:serine/threonine protein kinase
MSEEVNKKIGDYQILNELGSGGMGRVYRVRNVITDRVEAMKVLLPDLAGRQELAARFQREIKVLASLNHPNIAQLRTALVLDNQLVMIMEYVEGRTLADRLDSGPVPVKDAVNYIDQVLNALSYAHQQHVIHRDIKPANMMLTPQGVVKLMDFGIARSGDERSLTMTGTTLGSLNYMSPEQVKGEATDARSDLYSVGVSLYELVTGRRPFQAGSDYSIMAAHINDTAKPPIELQPGLSPALNEIILIGIAKDPAQRFQTADAFRNALSSVHEGATAPAVNTPVVPVNFNATAPVLAPPPTRISSVAPPAAMAPMPPQQGSSHRGLYMTLGALVVLAVLVVAGIYIPRSSKTQAKNSEPVSPASSNAEPPKVSDDVGSQTASQSPATTAPDSGAQSMPPPTSDSQPSAVAAAPSSTTPTPPSNRSVQDAPAKTPAHGSKLTAKNNSAGTRTPAMQGVQQDSETAPAPSSAPANNSAGLDELEHEVDLLSNRAAAVNSGLDRLQQQQSAAGYGLRGDMVAKQSSMKNNLSKAQDAIDRGDSVRARKYADLAQGDVEALEHFLGR